MDHMRKLLAVSAAVLALALGGPAQADAQFESFIQSLWPRVKAAGFSRDLFDRAFAGISEPDEVVLKLAKTQPEFTSTTSEYLAKAVTPIRIESGQAKKAEEAKLLAAIEKKYGVDRHILLGIWGMESNFGKDKGSMSVMRSLATLIYRRAQEAVCAGTIDRCLPHPQGRHPHPGQLHRFVGGGHGAHAVHSHLLPLLRRRLDGGWQAGHLGLERRCARLDRELPRQGRLEE
jgi:hypothetical protein